MVELVMGDDQVQKTGSRTRPEGVRPGRPISIQDTISQLALWGGADALDRICLEITQELGVLVEQSLLLELSLGRVAARLEQGALELEESHLRQVVQQAVDVILSQDYEEFLAGRTQAQADSTRDLFVVQGMGFHPEMAHVVAVRYNRMPIRTRRVFAAVLIRHESPEEVFQREGGWDSCQEMLEGLFDVIQMLRDPEVPTS